MIDPNIVNRQPHLPTPDWAVEFIQKLCNEYNMPYPKVTWMMMEADEECGGWYVHSKGEIYIVASGNRKVDEHSIIHEFAHYVTEKGHSPTMYSTLLDIADRMRTDMDYLMTIETEYQPIDFALGILKRYIK